MKLLKDFLNHKYFALTFIASILISPAVNGEDLTLSSPDGRYSFTVNDNGDNVSYNLRFNGKEIISDSKLDIIWNGSGPTRPYNAPFDNMSGMKIVKADWLQCDTLWYPVYGERKEIPDKYNQVSIVLRSGGQRNDGQKADGQKADGQKADGQKADGPRKEGPRNDRRKVEIILDVRAYNEGVAFRYRFPGNSYLRIVQENTEFTLPEATTAWFTPRAQTVYTKLPLSEWPGESERPLLTELPDSTYVCIGEAKVVDYVRSRYILSDQKENTVMTSMYGEVEEIAPYSSPWRVIMCADRAGEILENNYIYLNLNEPSGIDTSWIKPGKMIRETTLTTEGAFSVIDFAKEHNMSYVLFDTGWYGNEADKMSDATQINVEARRNPNPKCLDIEKVVEYGKQNGIGIVMYVNQRALQQQLDQVIEKFKEWGIAGIKFGFVQVGSQVWTKWLHDAVRKCGENGLLVDIHDEYRPTGVSRTYPNLMTQEGIRGNEEFPDATQNSILPFTRYVAGPADYTICYYRQQWDRFNTEPYGEATGKNIKNTPAHQLALSVVYFSPMQVIYWYDKPSDSQGEPELKFFDDVPVSWDDTKVLSGEVGQYATVARRSGDDWFVGAITNTDGRTIDIDLGFLADGVYEAQMYTDGGPQVNTRTKVVVSKKNVTSKDSLSFDLRPSGGVAVKLTPTK